MTNETNYVDIADNVVSAGKRIIKATAEYNEKMTNAEEQAKALINEKNELADQCRTINKYHSDYENVAKDLTKVIPVSPQIPTEAVAITNKNKESDKTEAGYTSLIDSIAALGRKIIKTTNEYNRNIGIFKNHMEALKTSRKELGNLRKQIAGYHDDYKAAVTEQLKAVPSLPSMPSDTPEKVTDKNEVSVQR